MSCATWHRNHDISGAFICRNSSAKSHSGFPRTCSRNSEPECTRMWSILSEGASNRCRLRRRFRSPRARNTFPRPAGPHRCAHHRSTMRRPEHGRRRERDRHRQPPFGSARRTNRTRRICSLEPSRAHTSGTSQAHTVRRSRPGNRRRSHPRPRSPWRRHLQNHRHRPGHPRCRPLQSSSARVHRWSSAARVRPLRRCSRNRLLLDRSRYRCTRATRHSRR